ncbi:HAD family hydrolase [Alteromonas sp. KS69]|jgi:phosphoglycolate phosphatase|uniref:Phosphoglycolate phosphatase n=1 Tax=Alteromonas naphthalenivorans TaxID=715451 RepID=F5Z8Y7_ALTNA|nr:MULTISPECIES: HAD-IIIA family hydrolase [Alteromonas]AEF03530.1 putative phosphoglycolate phosphatase [Alteromonas naphthalenivorans]MBB66144.1 HAD family hydrolase [Rickettsiales bacterium]PHS57342.1 MAG: HAD family hydrolase [Alteromonas sp.]RUP81890.1 HAD family hydrolase [Alteromonas sp. KS69]|tara:strand:+ start:7419 stop:8066 length:648 start_codon:yes stop_codon:yes gene_type:complete
MRYKLVIFDWDGTLMDSADKIINCMQIAAKHCDMPVPSADAVSHIIGISLKPAIKQLFGINDDALAERLVLAYKEAFVSHDATPCPLFNGVEDLLSALKAKGATLAVATGKARRGLDRAWSQTETGHFFSASRCADDAQSKPSPDMLLQILDELNISANDAVMIGDTTYDMQMAKSIGMRRIGVSYGVHAQVHLEALAPETIVHSIGELQQFLLR